MYNKIVKNYQVNMGMPFQIRTPLNVHTIREAQSFDHQEEEFVEPDDEVNAGDIIENAREEAEMIIKEAQYEAMRILEEARVKADDATAAIEEEARQRGYEEGVEEARAQYDELLNEAQSFREQTIAEYNQVIASMEADIVKMVLDIAHKVLGTEIRNKDNVLMIIKQAIEKCANREHIVVRVAPDDYDYLFENKDVLLSMVEGVGELEIKKDNSLKQGACVVETSYGSVDAGVQTKLLKIEEVFMKALGK